LLKKQGNNPATYCVENDHQYLIVGYSEDYDVCKGQSSNVGMLSVRCRTFLNKSVEHICDRHKYEKSLMHVERQKG